MNLYLISQTENVGYDTYDSAVVIAESEEEARQIHPSRYVDEDDDVWNNEHWEYSGWCSSPDKVEVKYLGIAKPGLEAVVVRGIVLSSFNAG